jgi:hypothetical protein
MQEKNELPMDYSPQCKDKTIEHLGGNLGNYSTVFVYSDVTKCYNLTIRIWTNILMLEIYVHIKNAHNSL